MVRVEQDKTLGQFIRDALTTLSNILERIKHNLMSVFIVAELLFFLRNVYSNFDSLVDVSNRSVELECPLGLLRNIIGFSKKIVNELVRQSIHFDLSDHLDHIGNDALPLLDVEFECLRILLTSLVMLGGATPLVLPFIILGNLHVLVHTSIVNRKNNPCILVHFLMRLSDNESIFSLSTLDQELDSFLLGTLSLAVVCDHEGTLGQR